MKQTGSNAMHLRSIIALLALPASLQAQANHPREKPTDYPVHLAAPKMELAADYLVHSLPGPKGMLFVQDYLVIEVAAYPASKAGAAWSAHEFTLQINKRGTPLLSQSAGMVAESIRYSEAGMAGNGAIFGQPRAAPRFPGDPTGQGTPRQPRAPEPENPTGEPSRPEMSIEEICKELALSDGPFTTPVNGYLFFPFRGKTKSIHSLQLMYETADGTRLTLDLL